MNHCLVEAGCDALGNQLEALEAALLACDTPALDAVTRRLYAELLTLVQTAGGGVLAASCLAVHAARLKVLRAHLARLQVLTESQSATLLPRTHETVVYGRQGRCV